MAWKTPYSAGIVTPCGRRYGIKGESKIEIAQLYTNSTMGYQYGEHPIFCVSAK
jgi:hypothetical protein